MRPIPEQVRNLLKSKSMIGTNKPNFEIINGSTVYDVNFNDYERINVNSTGQPITGNIIKNANGDFFTVFTEGADGAIKSMYGATFSSEAELVAPGSFEANKFLIYEGYSSYFNGDNSLCSVIKTDDHRLLAFFLEIGVNNDATKPKQVLVFRSENDSGPTLNRSALLER